jgi:hypothetical protein
LPRGIGLSFANPDNLDLYEMVQPYGATNYPGDDVEAVEDTASEDTSLLGGASTGKKVAKREGHATIISCIGNLENTIVGGGELSPCIVSRLLLT